MKALAAIGWGFCGFCEVKRAIFRILRLFLGMLSLGKEYLFLATLKGHSGPPSSPITLIPVFFEFVDPKLGGGGVLGPNQSPADGAGLGGGACHLMPYILLHPSPLKSS